MSQVKIQGNASGTGIFTIASPNSNNTRTMTLADTDGTIYIAPGDGIQALASGVPVARTITAGTGISITNGNGVGGNPTISATSTGLPGAQAQVFTGNGTFTIPTGITAIKVTVQGGGGGGGGASSGGCGLATSGGGGAGGSATTWFTSLTPGNTLTVTVGSGGSAGSSSAGNGGTGGTTSVASGTQSITTVSGTGGSGGSGATNTAVGSGGSGGGTSGGTISATGQNGQRDEGPGGSSWCGLGGARTNAGIEGAGVNGTGYGSGGSGARSGSSNRAGGAGAAGLVVIEW